jgi:methylated-DNA-[protein]-cysteine S-methyltransferase
MSVLSAACAAVTLRTPDGDFSILASPDAVLASGWTSDLEDLRGLVHPDLRPSTKAVRVLESDDETGLGVATVLGDAVDAVRAYYAGDVTAPRAIPVRQQSGPFRELAWEVLRDVQPGERISYSEYAERSGRPAAVRAAAGACAMNAAALFVPCHRIVRTDGTLGGYRYGLALKESLLARETAAAS